MLLGWLHHFLHDASNIAFFFLVSPLHSPLVSRRDLATLPLQQVKRNKIAKYWLHPSSCLAESVIAFEPGKIFHELIGIVHQFSVPCFASQAIHESGLFPTSCVSGRSEACSRRWRDRKALFCWQRCLLLVESNLLSKISKGFHVVHRAWTMRHKECACLLCYFVDVNIHFKNTTNIIFRKSLRLSEIQMTYPRATILN